MGHLEKRLKRVNNVRRDEEGSSAEDGGESAEEMPLRIPMSVRGSGSMFPGVIGVRGP